MSKFERYQYADRTKPYVALWTNTSYEYTRDPSPDDEWDIGDQRGYLDSYGVSRGVPKSEAARGREVSGDKCMDADQLGWIPEVGDVVYMVIERYASGCTFGHTEGNHRAAALFKTRDEAEAWVKTPEADALKDDYYFGGHEGYLVEQVIVD